MNGRAQYESSRDRTCGGELGPSSLRNRNRARAWRRLRTLAQAEGGPSAIEYGLLAALVAVAIVAALIFFSNALGNAFGYVGNNVNNQAP